jgi:hypothetical protein
MKKFAAASIVLLFTACTSTSLKDIPDLSRAPVKAYELSKIPEHAISLAVLDHRPLADRTNSEVLTSFLHARVSAILEKSAIQVKADALSKFQLTISAETSEGQIVVPKHDDCVQLIAEVALKPSQAGKHSYDLRIKSLSCFSLNISKAYANALDQLFSNLEKQLGSLVM